MPKGNVKLKIDKYWNVQVKVEGMDLSNITKDITIHANADKIAEVTITLLVEDLEADIDAESVKFVEQFMEN